MTKFKVANVISVETLEGKEVFNVYASKDETRESFLYLQNTREYFQTYPVGTRFLVNSSEYSYLIHKPADSFVELIEVDYTKLEERANANMTKVFTALAANKEAIRVELTTTDGIVYPIKWNEVDIVHSETINALVLRYIKVVFSNGRKKKVKFN